MAPGKEKKTQVKGNDAEKAILEYLEQQYRPYSTTDIIQNLHGTVAKAAAVKAIENLSKNNKIVTKLFGKVSVSVANKVEIADEEKGIDYHQRLEELKEETKVLRLGLTEMQNELSSITKIPTDEEVNAQITALHKELDVLREQINASNKSPTLSSGSVNAIRSLQESIAKESGKRQRLYTNFLKYVSEFIDPKKLINDLGLEEMA